MPYMKTYHLDPAQNPIKTFVRGTLRYYFLPSPSPTPLLIKICFRYPGFSSLMQSFTTLGLLNQLGKIELLDWSTFVNQSLMLQYNITEATPPPLSSLIPSEDIQYLHESLAWLGLANSSSHLATTHNRMPPLPQGQLTPLSIFAYLLSRKLKYQPHETDMVVLSHEIITRQANGLSENGFLTEVHTSTLYAFGLKKPDVPFQGARPASAMARTVGLPLAIASLLVLEGKIDLRGVQRPTWPQIYRPILNQLHQVGLEMREDTRTLTKSGRTVADTLAMTDDATRIKDAMSRVPVPLGLSLDPETDPKLKLAGTWSRDLKQDFRDLGIK